MSLAGVYAAIDGARGGAILDGVPGPMELLLRYVEWLGDQNWIDKATTRLLSIESPAFNQFRREVAARHPREVDPVTGRW